MGINREKYFSLIILKNMNEIKNIIEQNPEGVIIGFGVGYIWVTNIINSHSVVMMLSASVIGALVGTLVQAKLKK